MAELKTKPTGVSVEQFLAAVEPAGRREDAYVLLEMMKQVSGEEPVMWGPSIIGFGTFHYRYASGHEGDMPVISFSPRKASMSVYGLHYYGDEHLLENIGPYKASKGCLYLGRFDKLDLDALREAVRLAWNGGKGLFVLDGDISGGVQT